MPASITDKITRTALGGRPVSTTVSVARIAGAATLNAFSLANWPTASAVHFATYKKDGAGKKIDSTQCDWKAIVSGSALGTLTLQAGTDVGNDVGDTIEMMPTNAWGEDLAEALEVSHNRDGSLIGSAVRTALGQSAGVGSGWTTLGSTPSTIVYNGNRSYTVTFNAVDLTPTLSNGMRLLLQRTVTAPSQCTSLNGTTQYYSKTSPAGMTFTDDFSASAWVKLSSYPTAAAQIIGRYNGTDGWLLFIDTTGTVVLQGNSGGISNWSHVESYQSIPLNKWVHIGAQLDMSAFTATTTTSYVMIDGVDVPAKVLRAGTNPTALVQGTHALTVGGSSVSSFFFPGKIAQAAIYSAKVTQATIQASISQGLVGTETSLISAYSFNNSINDLNTTSANNLTANGSAVVTNADSPFAQGATAGSLEYGIVMANSFSTNTTLTVQVPEGSAIPTSGGVSAVSYSPHAVPYGFPKQRGKWQIAYIGRQDQTVSSPAANTWYTPNTNATKFSSVPIGSWRLGWASTIYGFKGGSNSFTAFYSLSTSISGVGDGDLTVEAGGGLDPTNTSVVQTSSREKQVDLTVATDYYLVTMTSVAAASTVGFLATNTSILIFAENAYL